MNIAQKLIKITISFGILLFLSGCLENNAQKQVANTNQKPVNIAILAPVGGSDDKKNDAKNIGKELASMVKMGLASEAKTKIKLKLYDSSNPEKLSESMEQIIDNETDIIIGPLYTPAVKNMAFKAQKNGITTVSLSNNPALADRDMYISGHAPMRQLQKITDNLLDNNYTNFITLMPEGHYSVTVAKILERQIEAKGGSVAKMIFYDGKANINKAVRSASNITDTINDNEMGSRPVIIVADDTDTLKVLFDNMHQFMLDKKALIAGDNRADFPMIKPINIHFTGSRHLYNRRVISKAKNNGINNFTFLHAVAHDAGMVVAKSIGESFNKKSFTDALNAEEGFTGASGEVKFVDNIAQRNYDILRRYEKNGKFIYSLIRQNPQNTSVSD